MDFGWAGRTLESDSYLKMATTFIEYKYTTYD